MKVLYFITNDFIGPNPAQEIAHLNSYIFLHDTGGSHMRIFATSLRMCPGHASWVLVGGQRTPEPQGLSDECLAREDGAPWDPLAVIVTGRMDTYRLSRGLWDVYHMPASTSDVYTWERVIPFSAGIDF